MPDTKLTDNLREILKLRQELRKQNAVKSLELQRIYFREILIKLKVE